MIKLKGQSKEKKHSCWLNSNLAHIKFGSRFCKQFLVYKIAALCFVGPTAEFAAGMCNVDEKTSPDLVHRRSEETLAGSSSDCPGPCQVAENRTSRLQSSALEPKALRA
jgi:hypothetical protein